MANVSKVGYFHVFENGDIFVIQVSCHTGSCQNFPAQLPLLHINWKHSLKLYWMSKIHDMNQNQKENCQKKAIKKWIMTPATQKNDSKFELQLNFPQTLPVAKTPTRTMRTKGWEKFIFWQKFPLLWIFHRIIWRLGGAKSRSRKKLCLSGYTALHLQNKFS